MQGSIKLYRSFLNWEWWNDHNTSRVFLYLLLNANWRDSKFRGHDVPRGSLVVGRNALAKSVGLTVQQTRTALEHLKSTNEITTEATNKFTIVTIVNWGKYQCIENESTNEITNTSTNEQPTSNQQVTTSEEIKKEIKETKTNKLVLSKKVSDEVKEIIDYLNLKTGKNFKPNTSTTEKLINGRLAEGYTVNDFKTVIDCKVADWKGDKEMEQYLRPDTLFRPSKFEAYLNQVGSQSQKSNKSGISEELKNLMNRSYLRIKQLWLNYHGIELNSDDAAYFRDTMLSFGDENRIKTMVERFRRNADQDEISNFKEFTDKWLSENGNL